jgi:hypothetical protein
MENITIPSKRPVFLTIVCIISFVGLGMTMFKSLFTFAFGQLTSSLYSLAQGGMEEALSQIRVSDPKVLPLIQNIFESILKLLNVLPTFVGITFILSGVALAGVILMWNLRKSGFYMFCAAKAVMVFLPVLLIGVNFLSLIIGTSTFMIAAIFITLYALNLKAME